MKFTDHPVTYDLQKIMTPRYDFPIFFAITPYWDILFFHGGRYVFIWWHIRISPQRYCPRVKSSLLCKSVSAILSSLCPWSLFDDIIYTTLRCLHWKFLTVYYTHYWEISRNIFLNFETRDLILHNVKYSEILGSRDTWLFQYFPIFQDFKMSKFLSCFFFKLNFKLMNKYFLSLERERDIL